MIFARLAARFVEEPNDYWLPRFERQDVIGAALEPEANRLRPQAAQLLIPAGIARGIRATQHVEREAPGIHQRGHPADHDHRIVDPSDGGGVERCEAGIELHDERIERGGRGHRRGGVGVGDPTQVRPRDAGNGEGTSYRAVEPGPRRAPAGREDTVPVLEADRLRRVEQAVDT